MKQVSDKYFRWSGLAAILAGSIYLIIQVLHPRDTLALVTTPMWSVVHSLSIGMDIAAIIALSGIYARQAHRVGIPGFIGYLLFSLFFALSIAFHFTEAFLFPILADSAPKFVSGMQGLVTGVASEVPLGAIPAVYTIAGLSYLIGGFTVGLSVFRANVLPRYAGLLLASGALVTILGAVIPHPLDRIMAVPVGVALIWIGVALLRGRENEAPTLK